MKTNTQRIRKSKKEARASKGQEMIRSLAGVEMLGEVVIPNSRTGNIIGYTKVKEALTAAGLDPDAAKEILPKSAFARACRQMEEERQIDVFHEEEGTITFQFTKKELAKTEWKFNKECFLTLDKTSGQISCENSDLQTKAQGILDSAINTRTTSDITRIVHKLFDSNGDLFPLRDQGGVYFVPLECSSFVAQIDMFFREIGGSLRRVPFPSGTPTGNAAVKESIADSFEKLLVDYERAIKEFSINTRTDSLERAADKIKQTRLKIKAYSHYLAEESKRLDARCNEADKVLLEQVRSIQVAKENTPPKQEGEGKRDLFFGHPATSVIRWMGKEGWSFEDAQKVLAHHNISVAGGTIRTQLLCGRKGMRGDPAKLSKAQIAELNEAKK